MHMLNLCKVQSVHVHEAMCMIFWMTVPTLTLTTGKQRAYEKRGNLARSLLLSAKGVPTLQQGTWRISLVMEIEIGVVLKRKEK